VDFIAELVMLGEDMGDLHGLLTVLYDAPRRPTPIPPVIVSDFREGDLAAANTIVELTGAGPGIATGQFKVPAGKPRIIGLATAVGMDFAGGTRFAHQFELDGQGLFGREVPLRWHGWTGYQRLDTDGFASLFDSPELIPVALKSRPGFNIRAQAQMVEDDYGAGSAAIGILYG
jgi:hypothetical protein